MFKKELKSDIASELKRAFPAITTKPSQKKQNAVKGTATKKENSKDNNEPKKNEEVGETKIYDKVSSIVVEEINNEHLLLKGRKYLLYKGRKRAIEVQALVARRDVKENKTVNSDDVLEATLRVIQ